MSEKSYMFELPAQQKSIIKVIGVGGGGSNAVNHMYSQGIKDVEFIVCNTDIQALHVSPVPNKLQIGIGLTAGLGAGANPEKGKGAAVESKEEIREMLSSDTKMVFITAGMGGGTGTGAAPELAKVARELGVLTVGIVTMPFGFEGRKKKKLAEEGIRELRNNCDTVLVILNDKLRQVYGNLSLSNAFAQADNILTTAAKSIAEIITVAGYINVDFEDVKTVMAGSGAAVMGSAKAEGENRARRAAEEALSSPLLDDKNILGARKILLSIRSGERSEMSMDELSEITEHIQNEAGDEAEMIFGHGIDDELGEAIMVTVIATGFHADEEDEEPAPAAPHAEDSKKVYDLESSRQIREEQQRRNPPHERSQEAAARHDPPQRRPPVDLDEEESFNPYHNREVNFDMSDYKYPWESKIHSLDDDDKYEPTPNHSNNQEVRQDNEQEHQQPVSQKKKLLMEEAYARKNQMRNHKSVSAPDNNNHDMFRKENYDEPAYLRKNVHLYSVPSWNDRNVSRYTLDDDNNILGNNKFLHDNVD